MGETLIQVETNLNLAAGSTTRVRWLPWLLFALTFISSALGLVFLALNWATPLPDIWGFRGEGAILALAFGSVGLLLARHRSQNPIGWLLLFAGFVNAVVEFWTDYAAYGLLTQPGALPGGVLAAWAASWVWFLWIAALVYIFLIFPTGRLPSARWRPVAWLVVGTYALGTFTWMVRPGPLWFAPYLDNPFANQRAASWINQIAGITALSSLLVGVSTILRLRRAAGVERQQLKWFAYAAALIVVIGMINAPGGSVGVVRGGPKLFQFFTFAVWIALAFTIGLAILRYRLWDIDLIINRTLVYGTLSAGIVVTYILLVGLFGTVLNTNVNLASGIVTLALTALFFRPLRTRLQRPIDRAIYATHDLASATGRGESHGDSPSRPYGRLAWSIASLSLALAITGFAISILVLVKSHGQGWLAAHMWFSPVSTATFALVGALVASRHPRNPIGWICSAVGLFSGLNGFLFGYRMVDESSFAVMPGMDIARWLDLWVWIPASMLPLSFLLLLFPDGRLPSDRWRLVGWSAGLGMAALILGTALHPNPQLEPNATPNPFGIPGAQGILDLLVTVAYVLVGVAAAGSVAALVVRFRRSRGIERAQLKWLAYAGIIGIIGNVGLSAWAATRRHDAMTYELTLVGVMILLTAIVAATGIAILRYRLYDIDLIVNRALVYGALSTGIAALYVLLVGAFSTLSQTGGNLPISLLATGLIAFLFQPLRERLQRGVNRLMYGERDDPYALMARLGENLETTGAPDATLVTLVGTIAQALKLPYVAIETGRGDGSATAAAHGQPRAQVQRFPLAYQAETVGYLLVAPRGPNEPLSSADLNLLRIIAQQAGMAVHAVQLTEDLQRSRERLVVAREEERRRIRRDLHDGLGPALASLAMQADNAREWTLSDPGKAEAALEDITTQAQTALQDIRRLVYDLRPPALDELGLVGALRQTAANSPNGLHVDIDAPEPLPALSAAVEVAAYRIAQEALNNVVRHSHARHCVVVISVQEGLRLEIRDDGAGLPPDLRTGVGRISMRERAVELGGSCVIESTPGGGTRVLARLPLAPQQESDG